MAGRPVPFLAGVRPRPRYHRSQNVCPPGASVPGGLGRPQLAVWKGDMVSATIAAASVLAKCARDREMVALHARHPEYGFDVHKGYTTSAHRDALAQFGPSPVHRHRFITVRRAIREGAA